MALHPVKQHAFSCIAIFFGCAVGVFAFLWMLLSIKAISDLATAASTLHIILPKISPNAKEAAALTSFINKGYITSNDTLISTIISSYALIVTVLIGLIGLIGLAGFFIVRSSYRHQIDFALNEHLSTDGFKAQQQLSIQAQIPDLVEIWGKEKLAVIDLLDERLLELEKNKPKNCSIPNEEIASTSDIKEYITAGLNSPPTIITTVSATQDQPLAAAAATQGSPFATDIEIRQVDPTSELSSPAAIEDASQITVVDTFEEPASMRDVTSSETSEKTK